MQRELEDLGHMVWGMVIAIGAVFVLAAAWFRPRRGVHALLAGIGALWLIWSFWSYPLLNDSSSAKGVMHHARELVGPDVDDRPRRMERAEPLDGRRTRARFRFRESLGQAADRSDAMAGRGSRAKRPIFILEDAIGRCIDKRKGDTVGHANRREWWLVRADAIVAGCVPDSSVDAEQQKQDAPDPYDFPWSIAALTARDPSLSARGKGERRNLLDRYQPFELRQHSAIQSTAFGSD